MSTKTDLIPHFEMNGYQFAVSFERGSWRIFVRAENTPWENALMGVESSERAALEMLYRKRWGDYVPLSPEMEAVKRDQDAEEARQAEERAKAIAIEEAEREARGEPEADVVIASSLGRRASVRGDLRGFRADLEEETAFVCGLFLAQIFDLNRV